MASKTPEEITREASELIQQIQQSQSDTQELCRSKGLDTQKLIEVMNAQQHAEAEALFRQDMEAVEREVTEAATQLSFAVSSTPKKGGAHKMRNLI